MWPTKSNFFDASHNLIADRSYTCPNCLSGNPGFTDENNVVVDANLYLGDPALKIPNPDFGKGTGLEPADANSPLVDAGTVIEGFHCPESDDVNPNQQGCVHWKGDAPDIGAYEFDPGECYDNETEILTEEGWMLFAELEKDEKVMTLNQETGEEEWQLPTAWQEFDNMNGWLYGIRLEDGSVMRVSEKHKVYSFERSLSKSEVENILTLSCFLNNFSSDQIGI